MKKLLKSTNPLNPLINLDNVIAIDKRSMTVTTHEMVEDFRIMFETLHGEYMWRYDNQESRDAEFTRIEMQYCKDDVVYPVKIIDDLPDGQLGLFDENEYKVYVTNAYSQEDNGRLIVLLGLDRQIHIPAILQIDKYEFYAYGRYQGKYVCSYTSNVLVKLQIDSLIGQTVKVITSGATHL